MRDEDLAAFITCFDDNGTPAPAAEAVFFAFSDLQKTLKRIDPWSAKVPP